MICKVCESPKEFRFGKLRCRSCQIQAQRRWYQRNKDQKKLEARIARNKKREFVKTLKDKPCTDCQVKYPYYVMHFDHLRDKEFEIGSGNNRSYSDIIKEATKCDIVCANCHAIRTYNRAVVM